MTSTIRIFIPPPPPPPTRKKKDGARTETCAMYLAMTIITYSLPDPKGRLVSEVGVLKDGLSTVTVVLLVTGFPAPPGRRLRPRLALSYDGFFSVKPNGCKCTTRNGK